MEITKFEVCEGGTLMMANFNEAKIRSEFYEDVASDPWQRSPADLADAIAYCQPLAWAVQKIYSEYRDELLYNIDEEVNEEDPDLVKIKSLEALLALMPEVPDDGLKDWLEQVDSETFNDIIVPQVKNWFSEPPDWTWEVDYLPELGTSQGAALNYFRDMDPDSKSVPGVTVVEGEHPGSTYYAAELRISVAKANAAAKKAGIPVGFVKTH
jgi:hypothetical protein